MTVDTMGKPRDMRAFRQRQQERPAEVPKDIERRNAKSVQRSRGAHHEASKAGDANVPDSVRDVISSPGQQLDTSIQRAMEDRMGDNLSDVRIHTDPSAAKACEDINARAFTVGNHIAFNHGEYDPSSAEGQHILAHELAHVRQQTGGAVSMLPQEGSLEIDPDPRLEREAEETAQRVMQGMLPQEGSLEIDPDPRLEREAEETAQRVMQGGKIGVHRMEHSDVHVQRSPKDVSEYIPSMGDTEQAIIEEEATQGVLLDIDPEKLEQLQSAVADLEELATEINELSAATGVTVEPAAGETTLREETPTPLRDGLAVTVSHDHDLSEMGLSQDQQKLVEKHKQLVSEFETLSNDILSELQQGELPEESTFRDFLTDVGISTGVAAVVYKAIESQTDHATLASMLQSELDMVGPQGAGLFENITVAFGALLTGIALSYGKDKLTSHDETGDTRFDDK
ncbi:eCIS core domain-containing protein [Halogeometricum borinquense]